MVRLNTGEGHPVLAGIVYPVRQYVLRIIDSALDGQSAALLKALLVGVRGDVDNDIRDAFANAGVIHVLAVSGLHVGFVLAGLISLFSFLHIPNPWRILLVMLCLIFYALLTGLKPSVFRATVMAIVFLGGQLMQRRAHLLNTLSIAAIILLFISPLDVFEPGFQLSFAAVLGIIFIYQRLSHLTAAIKIQASERGHIFIGHIINLFLVSLAAQIATIPLTIYYFNRLSLISVLANLIVIPMIAVIVALGMVALLLSLVHAALGNIYLNVVWLLLKAVIVFVHAAQNSPFAYFVMPRPSIWFLLFYLMCIFLFVAWPQVKMRKALIFSILIVVNAFVWTHLGTKERCLKITFFDVGQGDSALFEFPNGKTLLVDAGDRSEYVDYGERVIYPYLVRNGINKIDDVIVTHAHSDHNGGVLFLLEKKRIGRLIKTHVQHDIKLDSLIDVTARQNKVPVCYVQAGDTLLCDAEILLMLLHPTPSFIRCAQHNSAGLNDVSIVFKCVYENLSILMVGDAERSAEESMMKYGTLLQSDILKCGHHGSSTSSSTAFRKAVNAQYGIISVARFNRFGLPSDELIEKFEKEGTLICRTDSGAVQFLVSRQKLLKL